MQVRASQRQRLAAAFNVEPGEGTTTILLLLLSFLMGSSTVFADAAATGLFLNQWGATSLPYVYIAGALVLPLTGLIFGRLQLHASLGRLLVGTLVVLFALTCVFWLALGLSDARWVVFGLLVWYRPLYTLTGIIFWGLAGRLLNLRQGKRLYGLTGSGELAARIVGNFSISLLVPLVGTLNLLLVTAASLILGLLVVNLIGRRFGELLKAKTSTEVGGRSNRTGKLFPSRYVILVFLVSTLAIWTFTFVDFGFSYQAQQRYQSADQIASFIGLFYGVVNVARLFARLALSGRLLSHYGLRVGLIILPLVVGAASAALVAVEVALDSASLVFWVMVGTRFLDAVLRMAVHKPAFQLLYQPLPPEQRLAAQVTAETMVEPVVTGLAGLLLLLFNTLGGSNMVHIAAALVLIGIGWIMVSRLTYRGYVTQLRTALAKRRIGGPDLDLRERASLEIIQQNLHNPYPGAALYALSLFEQSNDPAFAAVLPSLLDHPAPEVRREALRRIEQLGLHGARDDISRRIPLEPAPEVRAAAIQAIATLAEAEGYDEVSGYLDDPNPEVRRGALVGLLRSGGIEGVLTAGQRVLSLTGSPDSSERILAARVLGDVAVRSFYQPLWGLLHDKHVEVRRAAIQAAGKVQHPRLWPALVDALARPALRSVATQALVAGGNEALPTIKDAVFKPQQPSGNYRRLAHICGRIRGGQAMALLQDMLLTRNGVADTEILVALSACGYRAEGAYAVRLREWLSAECAAVATCIQTRVDLGDEPELDLLVATVGNQIAQSRGRVLLLLSLLYDTTTIGEVRRALFSGSAAHRAYAVEVIDNLLSQEIKQYVLPVLEDITAAQRLQRLGAVFPQQPVSRDERIYAIIKDTSDQYGLWSRAHAMYAVGRLRLLSCRDLVAAALDAEEPLLRETALVTLRQFDSQAHHAANADEGQGMLSMIERVIILKSVSIFAETPDDVLAEVAALVTEVQAAPGEVLFRKGDLGSSMYVIVSGKIRVHDGDRTLNDLGERDVFGEMAVLDPEPRVATATALEETHLFRVDQEPFYELMADRIEVARGIIRVLTRYVRARVRDVAVLHARVEELEQAIHEPIVAGNGASVIPDRTGAV